MVRNIEFNAIGKAQKGDLKKVAAGEQPHRSRLMEEINILRLEGSLFCFDPREAKRRTAPLRFAELSERPVTIEPNPNYGQPSVLAYRVLQAIFLKMTDEGYPYPDTVSFSLRELAQLAGRAWGGKKLAEEIYRAIMQLHTTLIRCSIYDNETKQWEAGSFHLASSALFAGHQRSLKACVVEIDKRIARSINKRHIALFNLHRLNTLDTIGMVLYKRVFFHLSNLYQPPRTRREDLIFEKDYEAICREWLGGLKPERYRSKILQNQLGRHLAALKSTQLISRCDILPRAGGKGFKLVFYPGSGFFDDYGAHYLERQQPRLRFKQTADLLAIQKPIQVVAYFHGRLGRGEQHVFEEKETACAAKLLNRHSEAELRELVDYAIAHARDTNFGMRWFGAVKLYEKAWQETRAAQDARRREVTRIRACPHCGGDGMLTMRVPGGGFTALQCPHDIQLIIAHEEANGVRRV